MTVPEPDTADTAYDPYEHLPPPDPRGPRRGSRLRGFLVVVFVAAVVLALLAVALKPGP